MNSIFDLNQSALELPSINQGVSKLTYVQNAPLRNVTGTNFPGGAIRIKWEVSGSRWWIPNRSYLRLRFTLGTTGDAAVQINIADDVAPNMALMPNLFQSLEFRIADKTVSRVSDYVAQIDALEKRMNKSRQWLNGLGGDLEWLQPEFRVRQNLISSDGYLADLDYHTSVITRAVIGFDAGTTLAIAAATRTLTIAAGAAPSFFVANPMFAGDIIEITATVGAFLVGERYRIENILTATTARVERLDAVIAERAAAVALFSVERKEDKSNYNISSNRNQIEVIWQPPLSIFKVNHAMPAGKYELILNPHNTQIYMKRAIESLLADKVQGVAANEFQLIVDDMYLYTCEVQGPVVDDVTYFLDLEETRCQATDVDNNVSLQQKSFDVSPDCFGLTVAWQDQDAGQDTRRSASKLKVRSVANVPSGELALERFYIIYNGESKPSPDTDPNYNSNVDYISQLYAETMLYNGGYFDMSPGESKYEWIQRGPYLYYAFPKDGSSQSTRVNVNYQFRTALGANVGNVLLFDHVRKTVLVEVKDGKVYDLKESN